MPTQRIQIYKLIDPELRSFASLFSEEVDSAFTADIVCCEACYDDFVKRWPAVYLHDLDFQAQGIHVMDFYKSAGFNTEFTEEEFRGLLQRVECPRCLEPITSNFWAYNLPFDVPSEFEDYMDEIAAIAARTPFLVLSHHFAQEIHKAIEAIAANVFPSAGEVVYYRARPAADVSDPTSENMGHPPAHIVSEGRFNHAGAPVLYLATSEELAFAESGSPESGVKIAKVTLSRPPRLLDLSHADLEESAIRAVFYSALVGAPPTGQGWSRPEYVFSRFVADCVKGAGLDGIKYQSARLSSGWNIVIFRGFNVEWKDIYRIESIHHYEAPTPKKVSS